MLNFLVPYSDKKLDWEARVTCCRLKIMSSLFALRNDRDCVNVQTCKLLHYTFNLPVF